MTTGRVLWIIWCCACALFWLVLGFTLLVPWLLVPPSLLAILLPVGKPRRALR